MLQPKRSKYRKSFRGRRRGISLRGSELIFGEFGLKSIDRGWVAAKEIEAARKAISHQLKKGGRIWIRVFPDKSVTSRAAGHRMGGGKGEIDRYVMVVRPGRMMFEVAGADEKVVKEAFARASAKLSVRTIFVKKE